MEITVPQRGTVFGYVNIVYHVLLLLLSVYVLSLPIKDYRDLLSWHAILGTLAFLTLMSEAITLFPEDVWYCKWLSRKRKIWVHGITLGVATIFAILSVCFEYHRKASRKGHLHFDSVHGVAALVATILLVLAALWGLLAANKQLIALRPLCIKMIHNILGQLAYLTGMLSLCCAYYSNWMVHREKEPLAVRVVLTVCTCLVTFWSLVIPLRSLYNQLISLRN